MFINQKQPIQKDPASLATKTYTCPPRIHYVCVRFLYIMSFITIHNAGQGIMETSKRTEKLIIHTNASTPEISSHCNPLILALIYFIIQIVFLLNSYIHTCMHTGSSLSFDFLRKKSMLTDV